MRCCDNSVARISNVFGSEHMRLMRSAKLYGIFLEQCYVDSCSEVGTGDCPLVFYVDRLLFFRFVCV